VPSEASDVFTLSFAIDPGGNGCGGDEGDDDDHDHDGHHGGHGGGHGQDHGHQGHGRDDDDHGGRDKDRDRGPADRSHDDDGPRAPERDKAHPLDTRLLAEYCGGERSDDKRRGNTRDEAQTFARWLAADLAMSRLAAEANRGASWLDPARGADIGGLGKATGSLNAGRQLFGDDAVTLMPGAGLKGFTGLQEGMRRLG
jgi:hypothetical protein